MNPLHGQIAPTILRARSRWTPPDGELLDQPIYRLVYIKEGMNAFDVDGEKVEIGEGSCYMLQPDNTIVWKRVPGTKAISVIFTMMACELKIGENRSQSRVVIDHTAVDQLNLQRIYGVEVPIRMDDEMSKVAARTLREIVNRWWLSDWSYAESNFLLQHLLHRVLEHYRPKPTAPARKSESAKPEQAWITHMHSFFHNNMATIHSTSEFAAFARMSAGHFTRLFQAHGDETPAGFMRRTRLAAAARLLRNTEYSVTAIAQMTGYRNREALEHAWKKQFDLPPIKWRRATALEE